MSDLRECPHCKKEVERNEMIWVNDHYGIPFKLVCFDCAELGYEGLGGQPYDELDECIDEYW